MPKRKLDQCAASSTAAESEDSNASSSVTDGSTDVAASSEHGSFTNVRKKVKKSVKFEGVTVFYFPRKQGFTCVPSQGGSTLGMSEQHMTVENFSLSEYKSLQRQLHHQILLEQHQQGKIILPPDKLLLSKLEQKADGDSASASDEEEDFSIDDYYFLQPVPTRQRRMLLRQSGIKKIEAVEKDECKEIRSSREVCGCNCKVFCDPQTCICSQAGIKCQVDRLSFPCGCSKDGCGNLYGRIEFNPIRVRTHFIHTLMRLEMDKKKGDCMDIVDNDVKTRWRPRKARKTSTCSTATEGSSSQCSDLSSDDTKKELGSPMVDYRDSQGAQENPHDTIADNKSGGIPGNDSDELESIDLNMFNSNERGSCRDCQKSELSDIILRESPYPAPHTDLEPCMPPTASNFAMSEEVPMGLPTVNTPTESLCLPTVTNPGESLPQVMMFSDDEEQYNAENTTTMFHFPKEESSYSESSDCSSEGGASVEEQPPTYQSYPAYSYNQAGQDGKTTPSDNQHHSPPKSTTPSIPPDQNNKCNYSPHGAPTNTTQQSTEHKYIDPTNSTNGYKLEPISEILNPLRYQTYPSPPISSTPPVTAWGENYCYKATTCQDESVMCPKKGMPSQVNGGLSSYNNDCSRPVVNGGVGSSSPSPFPSYPSQTSCHLPEINSQVMPYQDSDSALCYPPTTSLPLGLAPQSYSSDKTSPTAPSQSQDPDTQQPKYHELKSSLTGENSIASAYFTATSKVTASFDLAGQANPSTVSSFPLSGSQSPAPYNEPDSCSNPLNAAGSTDLYELPQGQTAHPVTSFDLPNSQNDPNHEVSSSSSISSSGEDPSTSPNNTQQNHTTSNFGEIIKESIVETVSA